MIYFIDPGQAAKNAFALCQSEEAAILNVLDAVGSLSSFQVQVTSSSWSFAKVLLILEYLAKSFWDKTKTLCSP